MLGLQIFFRPCIQPHIVLIDGLLHKVERLEKFMTVREMADSSQFNRKQECERALLLYSKASWVIKQLPFLAALSR